MSNFIAIWHGQNWTMRAGLTVAVVAVVVVALWLARSRTSAPQSFATLTLSIANSNRADGVQTGRIKLPPSVDALRIYLRLPDAAEGAARYRIELENEEGEKNPVEVIGRDAETITVELPAAQLSRGEYALRLFAVRPDGAEQRVRGLYYFIIE